MSLLKPTKPKIHGFILFIIGSIVFASIKWFVNIYLSRNLNPEEYLAFFSGYKGIIYTIVLYFLYLVWIYILIAIIYSMAKRKD